MVRVAQTELPLLLLLKERRGEGKEARRKEGRKEGEVEEKEEEGEMGEGKGEGRI